MGQHADLVLLVRAIAAVQAGGGGKSITWGRSTHPKTIIFIAMRTNGRLASASRPVDIQIAAVQPPMDDNLHSPQRRLIELRIEHGDLDSLIDQASVERPLDELTLRRLKKRRLALRDQIATLEMRLSPPEPA
jgi:hypothetical protein